MTLDDACRVLLECDDWPALADAIAVVVMSPGATVKDLLLGLQHPGFISEQAAFELYKRARRPLPTDPAELSVDPDEWRTWLVNQTDLESNLNGWSDLQRFTESEIVDVWSEDCYARTG